MTDDPLKTGSGQSGSRSEKEPLHELTLGRSRPSGAPPEPPREPAAPADVRTWNLEMIAGFCRAKSDAARWAAERQRRIRERCQDQDDDSLTTPVLVDWAEKLTDSFYWANSSSSHNPPDISLLDQVAGCFETVADAIVLACDQKDRKGNLERVLSLAAEAQSMLRQSLHKIGAPVDQDQLDLYEWVRATAARHRIFLKRFMRGDDLANPAHWPDVLARIETQAGSQPHSQRQKTLLEDLRSHIDRIKRSEETDGAWYSAIETVGLLLEEGLPPSNLEIRDLLLPVVDGLPETAEVSNSFQLVLREIDRYLATRIPPVVATAAPAPTPLVQEAARLLSGRSLVMIGGVRRPAAQDLLRSTLRLKDLAWISTRAHQSIKGFESVIAQPDVALVLLAIRWSSHAFGDVKQFCEQYGKPLVRLPGGYSPNQVAAQIMAQCSGQLGG